MRQGLDFAWSKPSVDAILAGGYTFVLRYLSYDTTGKNLTRAEADSYRAAGIDVCSNWEYAANAALNGYSQGVKDATVAAKQHAACGGPPDAPIYFSIDFNPTVAQMPTVDAYMRGVASVLGVPRTGAYGGYRTIRHLFDAGLIVWGWQTYAWSAGQWDSRAQLRQAQNGITVGGADCDRNEAHADNFGQWGYTSPPQQEDDMWTITGPSGTVYLAPGDLVGGKPVVIPQTDFDKIKAWWANGVRKVDSTVEPKPPYFFVADLNASWPPAGPPAEVLFTDKQLAEIAAAAKEGAQEGAPTHDELVAAAEEGAQRAEDS